MKAKKYVGIIILIIVFLSKYHISFPEVIGENTYRLCKDRCCQEKLDWKQGLRDKGFYENRVQSYNKKYITFDSSWGYDCINDQECAECLDICEKELQRNNPKVAKKRNDIEIVRNTPTCFVNSL